MDGTDNGLFVPGHSPQDVVNQVFSQAKAENRPLSITDYYQLAASLGAETASNLWGSLVSAFNTPAGVATGQTPLWDPSTGHTSPQGIAAATNIAGLSAGSGIAGAEPGATLGSGYISRLFPTAERAVDAFPQQTATGAQWLSAITKGGTRPEEMDYRGIGPDTLSPAQRYTKTDIQNTLAANPPPQLSEVVKGYDPEETAAANDNPDGFISSGREGAPRYAQYQTPGGTNYREVLVTTPPRASNIDTTGWTVSRQPRAGIAPMAIVKDAQGNVVNSFSEQIPSPDSDWIRWAAADKAKQSGLPPDYISPHWNEPNVLAHARYTDRDIADIGKSLHAEEIQSDWHQAGRKNGYTDPTNKTQDQQFTVPDAPYKNTWPDLMLRRQMQEAVDKNYDAISWTDGQTQADRYDLSKQVSRLAYDPEANHLLAWGTSGVGAPILDQIVKPADLPNIIGKEAADKIINSPTSTAKSGLTSDPATYNQLSGVDLKVGGEGMKAFYDKMLPSKATKMWGKYGAKVDNVPLDVSQAAQSVDAIDFLANSGSVPYDRDELENFSDAEVQRIAKNYGWTPKTGTSMHVVKITPQLRDQIQKNGQPLFESGIPVPAPQSAQGPSDRKMPLQGPDTDKPPPPDPKMYQVYHKPIPPPPGRYDPHLPAADSGNPPQEARDLAKTQLTQQLQGLYNREGAAAANQAALDRKAQADATNNQWDRARANRDLQFSLAHPALLPSDNDPNTWPH